MQPIAVIVYLSLLPNSILGCAPTGMGGMSTMPMGGMSTMTMMSMSGGGRRKRSADNDVHVIVLSDENFIPQNNHRNMQKVEQKLRELAKTEGINFATLQNVPRTAENVDGKFGVHFTAEGEFERCSRIMQFIQVATNTISEIVISSVKCGSFDTINVYKNGRTTALFGRKSTAGPIKSSVRTSEAEKREAERNSQKIELLEGSEKNGTMDGSERNDTLEASLDVSEKTGPVKLSERKNTMRPIQKRGNSEIMKKKTRSPKKSNGTSKSILC